MRQRSSFQGRVPDEVLGLIVQVVLDHAGPLPDLVVPNKVQVCEAAVDPPVSDLGVT